MGIFSKKNKSGNRSVNLAYVSGIEFYESGSAIELSINKDCNYLTVKKRLGSDSAVNLMLNQVIAVEVMNSIKVLEIDKSSIGRAVAGGILLGPLGAIVGGVSGVGKKEKRSLKTYMIINYKSKDDEIKVLNFEIVAASLHWSSFVDELKTLIGQTDKIEEEIYL